MTSLASQKQALKEVTPTKPGIKNYQYSRVNKDNVNPLYFLVALPLASAHNNFSKRRRVKH